MSSISPSLKQIPRFIVTGFSTRTQNSDEFDSKTAKLPGLWQQFHCSDLAANETRFGVYSNYESDANGFYTTTAGIIMDGEKTGFSSVIVEAGPYLVFQDSGPMPDTVIAIWQRIWNYFGPGCEYQRSFVCDFEEYRGANEVAVYISVN